MYLSKKRGFTLIELLVVVAIIGILASVIMVSLNSSRAKTRDAQRMSDIKQIQNAIELYITDNGFAPNVGGGAAVFDSTPEWDTLELILKPYIPKLPKDPCGSACFQKSGSVGIGNFKYEYLNESPGSSNYGIMATNLESKSSTFIINNNLGSFN